MAQSMRSRKTGGVLVREDSHIFKSQWGWVGIAETAEGISQIVFPLSSRAKVLAVLFGSGRGPLRVPSTAATSPRLHKAKRQLLEYFAGTRKTFDLQLDLTRGTGFQRRVWEALRMVPFGQLRSYQGLAGLVGGKRYARAVGGAVGANPLPIVIPCHRVVAQDGSLGGFSCGLPAKRRLLEREGTLSRLRRAARDA
ncbi:MAG TPA: methylated-DNA--[protein]-cysteine S-methyltransferase [Nitrospira sp.]